MPDRSRRPSGAAERSCAELSVELTPQTAATPRMTGKYGVIVLCCRPPRSARHADDHRRATAPARLSSTATGSRPGHPEQQSFRGGGSCRPARDLPDRGRPARLRWPGLGAAPTGVRPGQPVVPFTAVPTRAVPTTAAASASSSRRSPRRRTAAGRPAARRGTVAARHPQLQFCQPQCPGQPGLDDVDGLNLRQRQPAGSAPDSPDSTRSTSSVSCHLVTSQLMNPPASASPMMTRSVVQVAGPTDAGSARRCRPAR